MDERSNILHQLSIAGEAMLLAGAEVSRVESTLKRIGLAYGAQSVNVFAITASLLVTVDYADGWRKTESRRIIGPGITDYRVIEGMHRLMQRCCASTLSVSELERAVAAAAKPGPERLKVYIGSILAAAGFAVFFGGVALDAVLAAVFAVLICFLQERLMPRCPNLLIFNLRCSFIAGLATCAVFALATLAPADLPMHLDKVLIGEVMLLIPGIYMTNAIRDILVGDTVAGTMRFIETMLWAVALACGFMLAIFIFGGDHSVGAGWGRDWAGMTIQVLAGAAGAIGFGMMFHLPNRYLAAATLGGGASWALYLLAGSFIEGVLIPALIASAFSALYAELLAHFHDTPSLLFVIPTVVPLIPGAPLYYAMSFAVVADWAAVSTYAVRCGAFALGIAGGMCLVWAIVSSLYALRKG